MKSKQGVVYKKLINLYEAKEHEVISHMKLLKNKAFTIPIIMVIYLAINVSSILIQFVPGMITLVFWSTVAPLLATAASWLILKKKLLRKASWIKVSSIMSIFFLGCGVLTFLFISAMWASV